jgi:hypothetical protein
MACIKRLGERVMTRGFERQVTEPQNRVSTLNRYTQLSMLETVRVGEFPLGTGTTAQFEFI